ncbi:MULTISPECIES: GTP cyclohydrolase II [Thalassospira]|uniref:GTP cyclohydrolase-2 n=2 Tax=Thalassospira TaxID=168934 RepID=A0A367WDN6_9PROT|nr:MULTISPECIES: GTP cyclohydrolase II [Thalassospira]MDG4718574.1 GTP cyclohydrolase II [Thalassospira sp. FZY0004]RCK39564.1 GTP cyclohydrolase [Thalassospira profundimaris]
MTQSSAAPARNNANLTPATDLVTVSRAVADLRRGEIVLVQGHENGEAHNVAVIAAEPLSRIGFDRLCDIASDGVSPAIVIPRVRAKSLGQACKNDPFIAFVSEDRTAIDADRLGQIANPLLDLDALPKGDWRPVSVAESAAIRLAKLARLLPAVVTVAVAADQLESLVRVQNLLVLQSESINGYENASAASLRQVSEARVPLEDAENATVIAFRPEDGGQEHLAIVIDEPAKDKPVLIRLHSECFTGDLIGSLRCDCGPQLRGAISEIARNGQGGIVLYLRQEGRGIGLVNKLRAYALQDRGFDTLDANEELGFDADERVYRPAAEMLRQLGFESVRLLTNNPEKMTGLESWGVKVSERVPHKFPSNGHNEFYLQTKKDRAGHLF